MPQRIAHRVDDGAGRHAIRRHLPQLLDADRVDLRQPALVELQLADERLGQVAAHAVAENRDLGADVDARARTSASAGRACRCRGRRCGRRRPSTRRRAPRTPANPLKMSTPAAFDLLRQPLHELVERDDVVAVVAERRRRDRKPQLALPTSGSTRRRAALRRRAARLSPRSRESDRGARDGSSTAPDSIVRARLARLVEHGDGQRLAAVLSLQLGQPKRRRHSGRPAADDEDVEVERLALGHASHCTIRRNSPSCGVACSSACRDSSASR